MSKKPAYLSLRTAAARLANLRALAEKSGTDWRRVREYGFHNWASAFADFSQGFNGANELNRVPVWFAHTGEQFRDERFADECDEAPRYVKDNRGWFSDNDQNATMRGIVARLTHGRFIAGYHWSENGERVYFQDVFDSEYDACKAADSHAESIAESEREYNAHWQAARDLENENESTLQRLRECLALRNNACFTALRDEARDLMETIRKNRATLATDFADVL
jgi:hypothetical protein